MSKTIEIGDRCRVVRENSPYSGRTGVRVVPTTGIGVLIEVRLDGDGTHVANWPDSFEKVEFVVGQHVRVVKTFRVLTFGDITPEIPGAVGEIVRTDDVGKTAVVRFDAVIGEVMVPYAYLEPVPEPPCRAGLPEAFAAAGKAIFDATKRGANYAHVVCSGCGRVRVFEKTSPEAPLTERPPRCETCGAKPGDHSSNGELDICPVSYDDWMKRAQAAEWLVAKAGRILEAVSQMDSSQFDTDRCGVPGAHVNVSEIVAAGKLIDP